MTVYSKIYYEANKPCKEKGVHRKQSFLKSGGAAASFSFSCLSFVSLRHSTSALSLCYKVDNPFQRISKGAQ
jgi:hypothetical protein